MVLLANARIASSVVDGSVSSRKVCTSSSVSASESGASTVSARISSTRISAAVRGGLRGAIVGEVVERGKPGGERAESEDRLLNGDSDLYTFPSKNLRMDTSTISKVAPPPLAFQEIFGCKILINGIAGHLLCPTANREGDFLRSLLDGCCLHCFHLPEQLSSVKTKAFEDNYFASPLDLALMIAAFNDLAYN